jgi:hypothetical protein
MSIHSYEADATYERIFYEQRLDYMSISSRSGRAIAHDEEPAISSHSNSSETHTAGSAYTGYLLPRAEPRQGSPASDLSGLERAGNAVRGVAHAFFTWRKAVLSTRSINC